MRGEAIEKSRCWPQIQKHNVFYVLMGLGGLHRWGLRRWARLPGSAESIIVYRMARREVRLNQKQNHLCKVEPGRKKGKQEGE